MDDQKPHDVFFFEQEGAFVLRLLMSGQAGSRHELAEFTRDDIDEHGRARPAPAPRRAGDEGTRAGTQDLIPSTRSAIAPGGTP